jgi:transposase-like protein
MATVPPLSITDGERAELQRRVRAHTTPQRAAKRARVVLLAADGVPNRQIAPMVGMSQHTVSHWRRRFEAERLAGLEDRPRPGRPLVYGHDQRLRIVATVTQQPPTRPATGATANSPMRFLTSASRPPRSAGSWPTSTSSPTGCAAGSPAPRTPGFWERAADVCGLYLAPPTNALVLSVDEKTGIGARSRTRPATPPAPGRPTRQEHEYVRHGTATLLAALDVHRGGVLQATDLDRNTAANFIAFLDELDARVPPTLRCTWCWTTGLRTSPTRPAGGSTSTAGSTPTTPQAMPPGSTRWSCSSQSWPAGCSSAASSPLSTIWWPR